MFEQTPRCFGPTFLAPHTDLNGSAGPNFSRLDYNPLNLQVNDVVRFTDPDLQGISAHVYQIASTKLESGGETYVIADYDLGASGDMAPRELVDGDGRIRLRLRCLPNQYEGTETIVFQAQRLDKDASQLFKQLQWETEGCTLRNNHGGFEHGFTRIEGSSEVYSGKRTCLGDPTNEKDPTTTISTHKIEYLDFERTITDSAGTPYQQWALVEFNPKTEHMITLFGWSIDSNSIKT